MRVAVEDLSGITEAVVSLEDGLVTVRVTADTRLTIAVLRKTIRNQGFSPRSAEIHVSGQIVETEDALALRVPGSGITYAIEGGEGVRGRLHEAVGREVLLTGNVAEDDDGITPTVLEVTAVAGP